MDSIGRHMRNIQILLICKKINIGKDIISEYYGVADRLLCRRLSNLLQ